MCEREREREREREAGREGGKEGGREGGREEGRARCPGKAIEHALAFASLLSHNVACIKSRFSAGSPLSSALYTFARRFFAFWNISNNCGQDLASISMQFSRLCICQLSSVS